MLCYGVICCIVVADIIVLLCCVFGQPLPSLSFNVHIVIVLRFFLMGSFCFTNICVNVFMYFSPDLFLFLIFFLMSFLGCIVYYLNKLYPSPVFSIWIDGKLTIMFCFCHPSQLAWQHVLFLSSRSIGIVTCSIYHPGQSA